MVALAWRNLLTIAASIWLGAMRRWKTIGIGEKIAFQVLGSRVEIGNQSHVLAGCGQEPLFRSQLGILDGLGDVEKVEAFGNRHRAGINIPAHDAVVDCRKSCRLNELVFSRLERAAAQASAKDRRRTGCG